MSALLGPQAQLPLHGLAHEIRSRIYTGAVEKRPSQVWDLNHLEEVFKRLMANNLKLKPKKYNFFMEHLEFLGYIIAKDGLQLVPAKVEATNLMATTTSKSHDQVFLGMIRYY